MNPGADREIFGFGGFRLDPSRRLLTRDGGEPVAINAKAFDALVYLVERAGTVVERKELYSALWPRTVVEDNNLSQTIAAIRRALGDTEDQRFLATVPRRGYQFIAPVFRQSGEPAHTEVPSRHGAPRIWKHLAVGVVAAALIGVAAWWWFRPGSSTDSGPPVASRSIAVLPFDNLSPDPQDAWFAAGMHEEVLARLASLDDVRVIGRTSVLRYADNRTHSLAAISKDLGVATVLEGSVRRAADRVRVNVRLVEGAGGTALWTETYDANVSDVFGIQSDIATRIATALESKLTPVARQRIAAQPTQSMAAYSSFLKARALYRSSGAIGVSMPPEVRRSIEQYLDEALQLDPRFAAALGWRAQVSADSLQFDSFAPDERAERIAHLMPAIARDAKDAIAIDPALGVAYGALARLHFFEYRLDDALSTLDEARKVAPEDPTLWQAAAVLHCIRNEGDAAVVAARRVIELDPANPGPYSLLSVGLRMNGHHEDAVAAATRTMELAPTAVIGYVVLARVLTSDGDSPRIRETLRAAEELLGNTRNFRLDLALSYASIGADADARRLVDDFRRSMEGKYIDPALEAMALLATREHAKAHAVLRKTVEEGRRRMDQMPLTFIAHNSWSDPVLETPQWRELRDSLTFKSGVGSDDDRRRRRLE